MSFAPDCDPKAISTLIDRAIKALAAFGQVDIFQLKFNDRTFILSICPRDHIATSGKIGLVMQNTHILSRAGRTYDAQGVLDLIGSKGKSSLATAEAPFLIFAGSEQ